ncbi:MAG: nitroreductase [Planctomycetes bacterium]|nr:nitroreductase [Planctomycetota bacterium]
MSTDSILPPCVDRIETTVACVLRGRRTIGAFRPEVPPREVVLEALELARWAPNHKKTEPWHVYWLGPETVTQVIALNSRLLTASKGVAEADSKSKKWAQIPGWLVVTSELATDPFRQEEDYAACCCLIQNLQLALWSAGVGTKWSTGEVTRHPEFLSLLGIDPNQRRAVGMIWYGYPAVVPEQTRRSVDSFLSNLP